MLLYSTARATVPPPSWVWWHGGKCARPWEIPPSSYLLAGLESSAVSHLVSP
jgi:hypothetical protein